MVERIYIALWGIYFIALAMFFIGGLLTAEALVIFGLVLFGLIFLGMIGVLPHYATHSQGHLKH